MPGRDDDSTRDEGAAEVDAFLAALPDDQRGALIDLRNAIRTAAPPTATEGLSYGVPAFKLNGRPLVSYGAGKAHCAFYVMSTDVIEAHAAELEGFDLSGKARSAFSQMCGCRKRSSARWSTRASLRASDADPEASAPRGPP